MRRTIEILLLTLMPQLAWAAGPISLEWRAPEACASERVLVSRVEALLGRSLDETFERSLRITATATIGDEASVRIVTVGEDGDRSERELDGADCAAVLDATALIIAIAIDPAAISWSPEPEPEPEVAPSPPPVRTGTTAVPTPGPPDDKLHAPDIPFGISLPRLDFRAGLRGGTGIVPEAGLGIGFGGAVLWAPLRFQAAGTFWFSRDTPRRGTVAEASLISVDGDACYVIGILDDVLELPICGGLEVGRFAVDPTDQIFAAFRDIWAGGTVGSGLGFVFADHLALMLEVEGVVSFVRPRYEFPPGTGMNRPVQTGRFGVRGGLWLELRVP